MNEKGDYDEVTPLEWAKYEFATIEYDYKVHPEAAKRILNLFERLADGRAKRGKRGLSFDEKFLLWGVTIYLIYMVSAIGYTALIQAGG